MLYIYVYMYVYIYIYLYILYISIYIIFLFTFFQGNCLKPKQTKFLKYQSGKNMNAYVFKFQIVKWLKLIECKPCYRIYIMSSNVPVFLKE